MSMAWSRLFSPNFIPISSAMPAKHLVTSHPSVPYRSMRYYNGKRGFPLPEVASIPYQPIDMEGEFSGHGVTFEGIGDSCVAKMVLENGSTATLMLPNGLITSYKVPMWHGGSVELLHTSVFEENGDAIIRGGVSLAFNCCSDGEQISWSPTNWALLNISGNAQESIQVCI